MSTEDVKPITVKKLPLILNKNIIIQKGINPFKSNMKLVKSLQNSVQEDIIYTSKTGDFTAGEVRNMTIVNRLNMLTNSCTTVAKCQSRSGQVYEKTSEEITRLIGQNNYDFLFSSICSIISHELKIRSINSLLTVPKKNKSVSCQTEGSIEVGDKKDSVDVCCQTHESSMDELKKFTPKRRVKRQQLAPYVVKDGPTEKQPRKVVISPNEFDTLFVKEEETITKQDTASAVSLPELGSVFDEDSNNSIGRFSSLSVATTPDLLINPFNMLVDKHTKDVTESVERQNVTEREYKLHNMDGGLSPLTGKVEFGAQDLHNIPKEQRTLLLLRQGIIDWKKCLTPDNDGHLPIHIAVLTNDVDLLRRQCIALKRREMTVDLKADGLTPLRMSLFQENTQLISILLHFGADIMDIDEDDRTVFHIAAEMDTDHLPVLVTYCQQNARQILHENEDLWRPGYEDKPDEELAPILMMHINKLFDNQGYTALMLASKLGRYNNVLCLVESCRAAVNATMPNSGNTALYLAVGAACMDAAERGNKTKIVDHFGKTVEILVENGADPNIDNFAGSSVNDLLTEFNIGELSMLIANKLTSVRYFGGQLPNGVKGSDFMLFKDDAGRVNIKDVHNKKRPPKAKSSPVILENVPYKPPVNVDTVIVKPSAKVLPVKAAVKADNSKDKVNVTQSYTPMIKNFKLSKPVLIKSDLNNKKRKLEIVVEPSKSKKNTTD